MNQPTTPYTNDLDRLLGRPQILRLQAERAGLTATIKAANDGHVPPADRPTGTDAMTTRARLAELDVIIPEAVQAHRTRVAGLATNRLDDLADGHKLDAHGRDLLEAMAALTVDAGAGDAIDAAAGWRRARPAGRQTWGLPILLAEGDTERELALLRALSPQGRLSKEKLIVLDHLNSDDRADDWMAGRSPSIAAWVLASVLDVDMFPGQEGGER